MSPSHFAILFIIVISLVPLHGYANGQGFDANKLGSSVCHLGKCPKHREEVCYCCFNDRSRCYRSLYKCVAVCNRLVH
uniref:EMBRYO SURROUNDING FACTOR 1-like protein 6 n=1 Tax=Arabidopsis thaliana TaxID=3702 RepID=ESFL6_ARATH|nr:RecName: Full=EMBRYO SURROUNDING FACTOR 1-like protein 6; Flags: Precursor [Arabidopsis thaliana]